jgi:hypothetical protein
LAKVKQKRQLLPANNLSWRLTLIDNDICRRDPRHRAAAVLIRESDLMPPKKSDGAIFMLLGKGGHREDGAEPNPDRGFIVFVQAEDLDACPE